MNADGEIVDCRARRRSGLSRMSSVFRGGLAVGVEEIEEVSDETADDIVVLTCARSSDLRVWCPGAFALVLVPVLTVSTGVSLDAGVVGTGGLRASTILPGGPRTETVCGALVK